MALRLEDDLPNPTCPTTVRGGFPRALATRRGVWRGEPARQIKLRCPTAVRGGFPRGPLHKAGRRMG